MPSVLEIKICPNKFAGQVVSITGAAQGLREATSVLFGSQGATVVLVDNQKEKLENVAEKATANGGKANVRLCNVGDEKEVNKLIEDSLPSTARFTSSSIMQSSIHLCL